MLSSNTDYQNNLLNRLAYCDLKKGTWKSGDDLITVLKANGYTQLADELSSAGIKGLKIRDYVNNNSDSGFAAIAFEDIYTGERGMSFRGTENLDKMGSDIGGVISGDKKADDAINSQIDMIDNASTAITGDSAQAQEAIAFYEKNRSEDGDNYLYGHSKGGELAAEVFSEYHDEIQQVHVINPQPINWASLTEEQKKAFNSGKFDAVVVDGDLVWLLGGVPYPVRIIENNGNSDGFFGPHELTSAKYDPITGEAIIEDEPYKDYVGQGLAGLAACIIISTIQAGYDLGAEVWSWVEEGYKFFTEDIPEAAQKFYDAIVATYDKVKNYISGVKDNIKNFIGKMGAAVKNWYNRNLNAGYKYASANPQINVDTYKLRTYAQRLQRVNGRISRLDGRLDSLYWRVGLLDLWNLMQADILTGYSWRLNRCVSYLNDTATDFENAESALLNNL